MSFYTMIKAIAIDDEPISLKVVEYFCAVGDTISLEKTFTNPKEALKYLKTNPIDLLFLDINMPSLSGIELYKMLQSEIMVIFTTASMEHAIEGFNLNAIDYLLKPFSYERFAQAVNKAKYFFGHIHEKESQEQQYLFVRADYSLIKINVNDILFIEGLDDYLRIKLVNQKPLVTRMTMKSILENLPAKEFIRVHRSYIVPVNKIKSVRNKIISIEGDEIPIGSSYEEAFLSLFKPKV